MCYERVHWIYEAQDRDQWRSLMNKVMNIEVQIRGEN
jgi:hypothetical protein